jgi:hypothetical protein
MFSQRAKVFAFQQIREKEQDKICFFFGGRSTFGTQMHIQRLHGQRQQGPLLTVIISWMCTLFL